MAEKPKISLHSILVLALILVLCIPANGYRTAPKHPLDIVFCLDLSGSTNGLIVDLKKQIWDIVNECQSLSPQPDLRIGVVAFSRPSFGKNNFYVKTLSDLSSDFDALANTLYDLKTSIENGDHNVGAALSHSIHKVDWSNEPESLKLLFLIGNGDVRKGSSNYASESENAFKKKGIIINTVFCKPSYSDLEMSGWRRIAKLGGGKFFEIEIGNEFPPLYLSNKGDDITELAKKLNGTYLYYGPLGKVKYAKMVNADKHSRWESQFIFESRMYFKSSSSYDNSNAEWDLVDYVKTHGKEGLANIEREFLPEEYQVLNNDDLFEVILKKKNDRNRYVCELRNLLSQERQSILNQKIEDNGWQEKVDVIHLIVKSVLSDFASAKGFEALN